VGHVLPRNQHLPNLLFCFTGSNTTLGSSFNFYYARTTGMASQGATASEGTRQQISKTIHTVDVQPTSVLRLGKVVIHTGSIKHDSS
jgi:hypothetical protein